MQGLAIVGVIVLAAIVYALFTGVVAIIWDGFADLGEKRFYQCAFIAGGLLFIATVLFWATTPCPFFVGGGT